MTQEEKELLLKDLSARFPYGVKVQTPNFEIPQLFQSIEDYDNIYINGYSKPVTIEETKPYLRPMSDMTEEEYKEWRYLYLPLPHDNEATETQRRIDWLNSHHFDYRGLIPMGLALEAPEDMYKSK